MSVRVFVNGQMRELSGEPTIDMLVRSLDGAPEGRGVAVAVEGEVVRHADWSTTKLPDGARVEVVTAVQGG